MRRQGGSEKSRLAIGLTLYVIFVLALALRLGILPDESQAVRQGRASLCEAMAVNTAVLLGQNDLVQLESILVEIVRRDDDLASAGVRLADGGLLVEAGEHQASWQKLEGMYSTETQIQVSLGSEDEPPRVLQLRFRPVTQHGSRRSRIPPLTQLLAFVAVACFVGFRSLLGNSRSPRADQIAGTPDDCSVR